MRNALSIFSPSFEDDLLQTIGTGMGFFSPMFSSNVPSVDIRETAEAYILDMELPGMDEKDVEVNLTDRTLSICSTIDEEKEEKKNEDGTEYLVRERRKSAFSRRFSLPEDSDFDKINAKFVKGILQVNIPRKPNTKPRNIEIAAS